MKQFDCYVIATAWLLLTDTIVFATLRLNSRLYSEIYEGSYPRNAGFIAEQTRYIGQQSSATIQAGFSYQFNFQLHNRDLHKITHFPYAPNDVLPAELVAVPSDKSYLIRYLHHRFNQRISRDAFRQTGAFPVRCVNGKFPKLRFLSAVNDGMNGIYQWDICVGMGGVQWPRIQRQSTLQTAGKSSSDSASHYKFYAVFMESAKVDGKAYSGDLLVPVQLQVQFTGFQDVNDGVIKTVQTPPQRKEQECATGRQRQSASISTSYCEVASGYDVEPPVYTNTGMRSLTDHKDYGDWPRIEPFPADLWHRKIVEPIEEDRFPKVDERVYALPAVAPIKTNYAKASVTNQMNARKRKERNSSDESDGTLLNNLPSATEKKPKAQNSIDSPIVNRRSPRYNFRQERQFVGQIDRQAAETLLLLNV